MPMPIEQRPMVLRPLRPPMPDFDATPPARRPRAESAPAAPEPEQAREIHLLIQYGREFGEPDQVLAALTDRSEADALLRVHEDLVASEQGYDIRTVPIHTSAAAVLGLPAERTTE